MQFGREESLERKVDDVSAKERVQQDREENFAQRFLKTLPSSTSGLTAFICQIGMMLPVDQILAVMRELQQLYQTYLRKISGVQAAPERALLSQQMLQREIDSHVTSEISCRAGCAHCCNQKVSATDEEAELIASYVDENQIFINEGRLRLQANYGENEDFWRDSTSKVKRCAFLNDKNSCKIYSVRPMSCRKYLVTSQPTFCASEPDRVEHFVVPEAELMTVATWAASRDRGNKIGLLQKKVYEKLQKLRYFS